MSEEVVVWAQISEPAAEIFDIWFLRPEIAWAQQAWEGLISLGLASYSNEVQRTLVFIRLMALGAIYGDFCERTWDESSESEYSWWADSLAINQFRVAQLAGRDFGCKDELDQEVLLESALEHLVRQERGNVSAALLEYYGTESCLFLALFLSTDHSLSGKDVHDLMDEHGDEILNHDLTFGKMAGFDWVLQGMPSLH